MSESAERHFDKAEIIRLCMLSQEEFDLRAQEEGWTRMERRRLQRAREDYAADKKRYGGKLVTREDAVNLMGQYVGSYVAPVAVKVDALLARVDFLFLPWYQRLWIVWSDRARHLWQSLKSRIYRLPPKEENDGRASDDPDAEADGEDRDPGADPGGR